MDIDIYDVIFIILGFYFGQIVGRIFIYKFLHPYVVVPYLKKRKMNSMTNPRHGR